MATSCLGIAIDHRVRRLIQPTPSTKTCEEGAHQAVLNARGRELNRSRAEIDVTAKLAGPSTRGGIAVALQQPRDKHPFENGLDAVINDCATLAIVDELFMTASAGTLSIRKNVSVVDLLPYISKTQMNQMEGQELTESFATARDVFFEKQPDVILCAGKIDLPNVRQKDTSKGEMFKIESIGVGKVYGRDRTEVRLYGRNRGFVKVHKVNSFHPSHALNYHPQYSCMRQLQLLTVVQACTQARTGKWQDEAWMTGLRDACAAVTRQHCSPVSSPRSRQTSVQSEQPRQRLYIPGYEKLYSAHLQEIKSIILSFFSNGIGFQSDADTLYDRLLNSRLSSLCNDASLVLFEMHRLEEQGWEARFDQWNLDTLRKAALDTIDLVEMPKGSAGHAMGPAARLRTILNNALARIDVTIKAKMDLKEASVEFRNMAIDIESLLLHLLEEEETARLSQVYELGSDDVTAAFGGMSLGAKTGPAVTVTPSRMRYQARAW
ncbi:hypothetical protein F5X68DRAFT_198300 [Plectosphaerella plurivora]|uniref:Uncharacterized protein n=1 Tax=Plectosphaerella plurivora TaxID=936078 RepID=A0A9P9AHC5_9PEZI|nr:hypothetical protein F5X68DRAFT_198300 [Plectosphaerella plurivora]